jgi:hypothetical protein
MPRPVLGGESFAGIFAYNYRLICHNGKRIQRWPHHKCRVPHPFGVFCQKGGRPQMQKGPGAGSSTNAGCPILSASCAERVGDFKCKRAGCRLKHKCRVPHPFGVLCRKGGRPQMQKGRVPPQAQMPGAPSFRRLVPKGWETTNAKGPGAGSSTNWKQRAECGIAKNTSGTENRLVRTILNRRCLPTSHRFSATCKQKIN